MLWRVRISWRKKLALIGLFSLTVIVVVFSIVRVAVVTTHKTQADITWDITWLYMWSSIEMAVCKCFGISSKVILSPANIPLPQPS